MGIIKYLDLKMSNTFVDWKTSDNKVLLLIMAITSLVMLGGVIITGIKMFEIYW